jgi:ArsR family transcriptional regulator, zinc-responsive transcriptional repressor
MDSKAIELAKKQSAVWKVLGNSRRLIILWLLSREELSVTEIAERAGSTMQNVSQHLKLLKESGIVTTRRQGQTIYYQITDHDCLHNCPALLRAPDMLD